MAKEPGVTRRRLRVGEPAAARRSRRTRQLARAGKTVLIPRYTARATKRVWLTLDDGPHPTYTDQILKILDKHKIIAAFFVVGKNVASHGALVKKAFDAGHRIGNHSYSHKDLTTLSEAEIIKEIENTDKLIKKYSGIDKIFRPPYGAHNAIVDKVAAAFGYRVVLWNVDTLDWNRNYQPDKWVQHGIDQIRARDTSTVLNHDIHKSTAENYDTFIERIKTLGPVIFGEPSSIVTV